MLHRVRFQQIREVSSLDSGHPKHVLIPLVPTTPSECNERELRSVHFPRYFVHTQVNRISVSVRRNKVYPLMPRTLHVDGICSIDLRFSLVWLQITMLNSTQAFIIVNVSVLGRGHALLMHQKEVARLACFIGCVKGVVSSRRYLGIRREIKERLRGEPCYLSLLPSSSDTTLTLCELGAIKSLANCLVRYILVAQHFFD